MANAAAVSNYLLNVLNFQEQSLRTALRDHGFDDFADLHQIDESDIKEIAELIRKPGGLVPNPNANAPGAPANIPNPGHQIGFVQIKKLRKLVNLARLMYRIQRPRTANSLTIARMEKAWNWKVSIDEEDDDIEVPKPMASVDMARRTVEDIDTYLNKRRGVAWAHLAYVVRDDPQLPAVDLGFDAESFDVQLVSRSRHGNDVSYQTDNREVWNILYAVFHNTPGWNWISSFSVRRDGRGAYLSVKSHYLGASFQLRLKSTADAIIKSAYFDGKSRNFTLERLFERLNSAFTDLEAAQEAVPEDRKVRILLAAVRDPRFLVAKSTINANPHLKQSFNTAVNYLTQYQSDELNIAVGSNPQQRQISTIGQPGRGRGRGRGGTGRGRGNTGGRTSFSGRITDRYYTPEEWRTMTFEQQTTARRLRSDRDRRRGLSAMSRDDADRRTPASSPAPAPAPSPAPAPAPAPSRAGNRMSQRPAS